MTTPTPEPLPGLAIDAAPDRSPLAVAVRRTIAELAALDLVGEVDAARLQLALTMADVIRLKMASGRMSTIGHDARVLMDLLTELKDDAGDVDDELRAAMDAWAAETSAPQDLHAGTPENPTAAPSSQEDLRP